MRLSAANLGLHLPCKFLQGPASCSLISPWICCACAFALELQCCKTIVAFGYSTCWVKLSTFTPARIHFFSCTSDLHPQSSTCMPKHVSQAFCRLPQADRRASNGDVDSITTGVVLSRGACTSLIYFRQMALHSCSSCTPLTGFDSLTPRAGS